MYLLDQFHEFLTSLKVVLRDVPLDVSHWLVVYCYNLPNGPMNRLGSLSKITPVAIFLITNSVLHTKMTLIIDKQIFTHVSNKDPESANFSWFSLLSALYLQSIFACEVSGRSFTHLFQSGDVRVHRSVLPRMAWVTLLGDEAVYMASKQLCVFYLFKSPLFSSKLDCENVDILYRILVIIDKFKDLVFLIWSINLDFSNSLIYLSLFIGISISSGQILTWGCKSRLSCAIRWGCRIKCSWCLNAPAYAFVATYAHFCIVFSVDMFISSHKCFASSIHCNVLKFNQPIKWIVTHNLLPKSEMKKLLWLDEEGSLSVVFLTSMIKLLLILVARLLLKTVLLPGSFLHWSTPDEVSDFTILWCRI